jgi:hypothetical protein
MAGVPNKSVGITITKGGVQVATAQGITDANGKVVFEYVPSTPGAYAVDGKFAGDTKYLPSSAATNFSITNVGPVSRPCYAVGPQMYDGETHASVLLIGIQDTTVDAWEMGIINGTYQGYMYSNHNYPNYPVPGSLNSDADCKIPSNSYKEFWFKNFWITRSLGGAIRSQGSTNPPITGTTHLNHYRIQNGDAWARDIRYNAFKNHRAEVDVATMDMLDMARENGIYINFTIGGGGSEASSAFGAGPIFVPGTVGFDNYTQYCADFINAYGWHPAIMGFDLSNEPVNYNGDSHDLGGRSVWWDTRYGRAIRPAGANYAGYEEWEARYLEWKDALLTTVKSKITLNPKPLVFIGGGKYTIYWATWSGHTQANIDYEKKRTLDYAANNDLIVIHPYSQAEYNDMLGWYSQTQAFINKPLYAEEYGFAEQAAPWRYSYWPWFDLKCQQYGIDQCTMVLAGLPDPHPVGAPDIVPQPNYPGYPIPQSQMDAATAAWNAYVASH